MYWPPAKFGDDTSGVFFCFRVLTYTHTQIYTHTHIHTYVQNG